METLFKDLQFGVRSLLKRPGFTTIAVLTLALGIGANTAIFSVVNATLMRPLPVVDPDRLVFVFNGPPGSVFSYPDYAVMRDQNKVFDGLIAWGGITASLNSNDQTAGNRGARARSRGSVGSHAPACKFSLRHKHNRLGDVRSDTKRLCPKSELCIALLCDLCVSVYSVLNV